MKNVLFGFRANPEVVSEIDEAAEKMQNSGFGAKVGRGIVLQRVWESYKKTKEYKDLMRVS